MNGISELVQSLQIPENYKGERAIRVCIEILLRDEDAMYNFKEKVYPIAVSECNAKSVPALTKSIHRALEACWLSEEGRKRFLKISGLSLKNTPSNGRALTAMASYIRRNKLMN